MASQSASDSATTGVGSTSALGIREIIQTTRNNEIWKDFNMCIMTNGAAESESGAGQTSMGRDGKISCFYPDYIRVTIRGVGDSTGFPFNPFKPELTKRGCSRTMQPRYIIKMNFGFFSWDILVNKNGRRFKKFPDEYWVLIESLNPLLEVFQNATVILSGVYYPTSPLKKLKKYFENIPSIITCAAALNPCFNVSGVDYLIENISRDLEFEDDGFATRSLDWFHESFQGLYNMYYSKYGTNQTQSTSGGGSSSGVTRDPYARLLQGLTQHKKKKSRGDPTMSSEYEQYLQKDFVSGLQPKDFASYELYWGFGKQRKISFLFYPGNGHGFISVQALSEEYLNDEVQQNEATQLTDQEIALDASSDGSLSSGERRRDYMMSSGAEDDQTGEGGVNFHEHFHILVNTGPHHFLATKVVMCWEPVFFQYFETSLLIRSWFETGPADCTGAPVGCLVKAFNAPSGSILAGVWGSEVAGTIAEETGGMLAVCVGIEDDDGLNKDSEAENKSPPNIVADGLGAMKDEDDSGSLEGGATEGGPCRVRAARLICGAGILDEAGQYNAAFTISGVSTLLLCATVTSLKPFIEKLMAKEASAVLISVLPYLQSNNILS
ncbi:hypothetical protein Tco_0898191 [Tanacetum coccineum]